MKAKAQQDAEAALAEPLEVFRAFFLDGRPFIGGDTPSIADIRWAATLEFLRAIDYEFPAWAEEYMSRVESALGDAYSEPAADVRGYVESVKSYGVRFRFSPRPNTFRRSGQRRWRCQAQRDSDDRLGCGGHSGIRGKCSRPGPCAGRRRLRRGARDLERADRPPPGADRAAAPGAADVVDAVNFAREHGLLLSVKGGGHNVAGNAVNDGGLVIDLSRMRGVHVDPKTRTVRVQGGATWGDIDRETQLFGLAVPGGVVSTTGVAGLTLHGGVGHLRRKHGLTIDNLLSVEIVTADGQLRTASATENEDLFWAVRGAGSNFGVVTSFEFQAHPVGPMVMVGAIFYPLEDAKSVLRCLARLHGVRAGRVELGRALLERSAARALPARVHGRPVLVVAGAYSGSVEDGEPVVQPLRELGEPVIDLSGPWPWLGLQSGFDALFPAGGLYYWKSSALAELTEAAIDEIADFAARRPTPLTDLTIWHHGGAMSRVDEAATGVRWT